MSYVNDLFIKDLKEIMEQEWEKDNRAKWKDGSPVMTKRILQVVNKYDLSKGFPILDLRDINFKAAVDEALWIYSRMSNNIKDLNSKIWNSWANEDGEIAKAYGYQIAKPTMGFESQMHYVLDQIKKNPTSRRIMLNMFNTDDQQTKATESLIECAYAVHFSVKDGKLHSTLIQRSGDFLTAAGAGSWNAVQYSFLTHAIAKECNLEVGVFTHIVQDLHLYNKHRETSLKLLERYEDYKSNGERYGYRPEDEYPLPTIKIADKPFFELTVDDVELVGYKHRGKIERLEVAV